MATNGKLSKGELAAIPSGELRKDAAGAWNAPGGPADNGLVPTGSMSSYRTYDEQVYLYRLYQEGEGNLAAVPGTSNHGWGVAIDLPQSWMWSWLADHGARFGWKKTEAFSEPWHWNFIGGVGPFKPAFAALKKGSKGKRVRWYTKRLAFIHPSGHKAYLPRWYRRFKQPVVDAVRDFQRDQGLSVDGVIGEKTAHRISAVFHKQYVERHGRRKRRLRDKLRRRP